LTAHYDGRRYFNPGAPTAPPVWMVPRMLLTKRAPWPRDVPVVARRPPVPRDARDVIVTFVGHATFLVQAGAVGILIDPVYSERASPVSFAGPRRARRPGVAFDDLPHIALVLLSHNHYDHCDARTLERLERRFQPQFVTPLGNGALLRSFGIQRIEEIDWWQDATGVPVGVTATPAQHFSARGPFDRNRALWSGFLIATAAGRILFAGDSGYGPHFQEIRRRAGAIDLALLPIGAYEPRWFMRGIHMNPAEAVQAHRDLEARRSVGMHFGTFQLTPEAITDPLTALDAARHAQGVPGARFDTLEVGESLHLDPAPAP
jgi:L-ascorbate metabolism protein UlaG (beta-lactamase superfamily)